MCSGMPEAVSTFLTTHDINQMVAVQRAIIDEYKVDMVKYARSEDKSRIRECFESIPRQLSRDNKKFTFTTEASKEISRLSRFETWRLQCGTQRSIAHSSFLYGVPAYEDIG